MELLFITTSIILILTGLTQVALLSSYREPVWLFNSSPSKINAAIVFIEERTLSFLIYSLLRISWLVYTIMLFSVEEYVPIAVVFIIYHIVNLTVDINRYITSLNYLLVLLLPWSTLLF